MKNFFFLFFICHILQTILIAQTNSPKNQHQIDNDFRSIHFVSPRTGWIVGDEGAILKTTNGGRVWRAQYNPSTEDLSSVFFSSENNGVAVGQYGIKLITSNGGDTWIESPREYMYDSNLYDVFMIDNNNCIAVGQWGEIYKSTDGGVNWSQQTEFTTNYTLTGVFFTDEQHGIAVGSSTVLLKTTDGGITWREYPGYGGSEGIYFADSITGTIVSEVTIYKTTDGGLSWFMQKSLPHDEAYQLTNVSFLDKNNGVVAGFKNNWPNYKGVIFKTTNGGINWIEQTLNQTANSLYLTDVSFITLDTIIAVGNSGTIVKTTNGGVTWEVLTQIQEEPVLYLPSNGSLDVEHKINFSWQDKDADFYHLQIGLDSNFNSLVFDDSLITVNENILEIFSDNTSYFWRVRSKIDNVFWAWSDVFRFTTQSRTPRLISPANGSLRSPENLLLQWSETYQTVEYIVQVAYDSDFENIFINQGGILNNSVNVNLNYNTSYYWRVGATNFDNQIYWSDSWRINTPKSSFPLNIGNKWYYTAGSNRDVYYYGVVKEITDTLSNGFKVVTCTYFYQDSVTTGKEFWAYIDGEFYINDLSQIYYLDSLKRDTCIYSGFTTICRTIFPTEIFDIEDTSQYYSYYFRFRGAIGRETSMMPDIGIISTFDMNSSSYSQTNFKDSTRLVGMLRNGVVLGDTALKPPPRFQGKDWIIQTSGTENDLYNVFFVNEYTGTAVGKNGTILRTRNGGETWASQSSSLTSSFYAVFFSDVNTGTVVGYNDTIIRTTNGGNFWYSLESPNIQSLYDTYFTDDNKGIIVGLDGLILKTTDGGLNWNRDYIKDNNFFGIYFTNQSTAIIVGDYGAIYKSTDNGVTWDKQTSGVANQLRDVFFINKDTGWIVGGGIILKTTDGGKNWSIQKSGIEKILYSVYFSDENNGITVGAGGKILRTSNGGTEWLPQPSGTTNTLYAVSLIDSMNGWIVGSGGIILSLTQGSNLVDPEMTTLLLNPINNSTGISTTAEFIWEGTPGAAFYEVQISYDSIFTKILSTFTDLKDTSIVIDNLLNGTMYFWRVKTVDLAGFEKWSDPWNFTTEELLINFTLYQNYPNPFNPKTRIKYDLPTKEFVKLKIYDIIGEEIVTLINEEQTPGKYEVEFDGSNLSSGVYFYKIEAGEFVETKKLVLMK